MLPSDSLALREMYDPVCYVTGSKKGGGGLCCWFEYEAPLWSITECMPDSHVECEMSVFVRLPEGGWATLLWFIDVRPGWAVAAPIWG